MKIILILDDDNGMMFNKRRQSQDIAVREKTAGIAGGSRLWLHAYSKLHSYDCQIHAAVL